MDAAFLEQASQAGSGSEGGAGGAGAAAAQLHAWEHTNHAVLAVGWGVEPQSQRKYWIAMNTWGPDWGERGFFRIARGDDESAFESMAVAADVVLPAGAAGAAGAGAAGAAGATGAGGRRRPSQPAELAERGVEPGVEMAGGRSLIPSRSRLGKWPRRRHRRQRLRRQQALLFDGADDASAQAAASIPESIPLDAATQMAERVGIAALPAAQPGAGPGAWRHQPSAAALESAIGAGVLPRPVDSVPMTHLPRQMMQSDPGVR